MKLIEPKQPDRKTVHLTATDRKTKRSRCTTVYDTTAGELIEKIRQWVERESTAAQDTGDTTDGVNYKNTPAA